MHLAEAWLSKDFASPAGKDLGATKPRGPQPLPHSSHASLEEWGQSPVPRPHWDHCWNATLALVLFFFKALTASRVQVGPQTSVGPLLINREIEAQREAGTCQGHSGTQGQE